MQRKAKIATVALVTTALASIATLTFTARQQPYLPPVFLRPLITPKDERAAGHKWFGEMDAWAKIAVQRDLRAQGLSIAPPTATYGPTHEDAKVCDLKVSYQLPAQWNYERRELQVRVCNYPILGERLTYTVQPVALPSPPRPMILK